MISFNCTCIFYHIQLTRACPSPLAVIWYLCIGFFSNVNKTENLNYTYSQPGQQWTVFQIVTHTRLGGFKPMILNSRGASILQILISKFSRVFKSKVCEYRETETKKIKRENFCMLKMIATNMCGVYRFEVR